MSQQDLEERPFRLSFKKSWEKIVESLELDTVETNEGTEKTFESDTITLQSIRRKDSEIQRFLDETDRRFCGEKDDIERALKEAKGEADNLREKVIDLENALLEETEKSKRYFQVIEMMEKDNERLEEENAKIKEKYSSLKEKLCGAEREIEMAREESILKMLGRGRKNKVVVPEDHKFEDKLTEAKKGYKRMRTGTEPPKEREKMSKMEEFEMKRDGYKSKRSYADELWIKKFKFLKQKLVNEQKRSRNLECLISTQKDLLEAANKSIYQFKAEKRLAEHNQEKINGELRLLNEKRLQEKAKIDNVITFCDLIGNSSFSEEELAGKLTKVPLIVSSFLKGATETMSFENIAQKTVKLIPSVEKHEILKQFNNSLSKLDDDAGQCTARELEGIRSTLNNIAETLVQATPSADPSVLTNLDKISNVHLTLEECLTTESHGIMNPNFVYKGKNECDIFKRAVKNSHNMLWNIQAKGRNSTGDSSECKSEVGSIDCLEGK